MKHICRILSFKIPASFTIEAAVILPICFVIIVWFINVSFSIHNEVQTFTHAIYTVMKNAPDKTPEEDSSDLSGFGGTINADNLDGRKVLLKYRLLKDGLMHISGGLEDEH